MSSYLMNRATQPPLASEDSETIEQMLLEGEGAGVDGMGGIGDPTDAANVYFPDGQEWESGFTEPPPPPPAPYQPELEGAPSEGMGMQDQGMPGQEDLEAQRQALLDQHSEIQDRSRGMQEGIAQKNSTNKGLYGL